MFSMFSISEKNKKYFALAYLFLFSLFFALSSFRKVDNDILWHLKLGEEFFEKGWVTLENTFTWQKNLTWISQEWLYDAYLYLVTNYLGIFGFILAMFISYFLVELVYLKENKNYKSLVIFMLVAFSRRIFYQNGFNRPSTYSIILIALLISLLLNKEKNKKVLLEIFIISILMANIHGGCLPTCLLIIGIIAFFDVILALLHNYEEEYCFRALFDLLVLAVFFVGGLINPFFMDIYKVGIIGPSLSSSNYITEWRPISFGGIMDFFIIIFLLITIIAIVDSNDFRNLERRAFLSLALSSAFLIGGLMSVRALLVTFVVFAIFDYRYLEEFLLKYLSIAKIKERIEKRKILKETLNAFKKFAWVFMVVIFAALIQDNITSYEDNDFEKYIEKSSPYSYKIINYIKENLDEDTHLWNEYNVGNYLLYNDCKVFVDSRQHPYVPEFGGNESLDDLFSMYASYDYYDTLMEVCDKYEIEYIFWSGIDVKLDILEDFEKDWEIVIEDEVVNPNNNFPGEKASRGYYDNKQYLFKRK